MGFFDKKSDEEKLEKKLAAIKTAESKARAKGSVALAEPFVM